MKLYQEICDKDVLPKVISLVTQAEKLLIVSEGEEDNHQVQPDKRYYQALSGFITRGGVVVRYYFGGKEEFESRRMNNSEIMYIYAGGIENYQRAVIADEQKAMAKIGEQFVYSENSLWVDMLSAYLKSCKLRTCL